MPIKGPVLKSGLNDPPTDNDDQEAINAVKRLPSEDDLPPHLEQYERNKSMVQMDLFIPTIPVDASTFALWVEQNLPTFCTDIDQVGEAFDYICAADALRTDDDIAIAYSLHLTVRGSLMGLPSPVPRNNQKVVKPQFFDAYRAEKDHAALVDTAARYLTKKAVASSVALSSVAETGDAAYPPWGGVSSRTILATEILPLAIRIQTHSREPLLPAAVKPLTLPPYAAGPGRGLQELRERDEADDDAFDEAAAAANDGIVGQGWDQDDRAEQDDGDVDGTAQDEIVDWE